MASYYVKESKGYFSSSRMASWTSVSRVAMAVSVPWRLHCSLCEAPVCEGGKQCYCHILPSVDPDLKRVVDVGGGKGVAAVVTSTKLAWVTG